MKKILIVMACLLFSIPMVLTGQDSVDSTGFDGDNFSLEGALSIFKESKSLEEFEKKLNTESSYVNNLDLNEDKEIDYIQVVDNMDDDVHAIALQTAISENETQDIAVILIEKTGNENAVLQIIGDEDVFGEEKIIEPFAESSETGGVGKGCSMMDYAAIRIVVNVWTWPTVRFIYAPTYVVYHSPWRWHYYPPYWRTWHPRPWRWHYNKRTRYHVHFRPFHKHRVVRAHTFYKPRRRSSVTVRTRTTHTRTVVRANKKGVGVKTKKTTLTSKTKKNNKVTTKTKSTTKVGVKREDGKITAGKKTTKTKKKNGKVTSKTSSTTKVGAKKEDGKITAGKKTSKSKTTVKKDKNKKVKTKKTSKSKTTVKKGKNKKVKTKKTKTKRRKKR